MNDPVENVAGVGKITASLLANKGITTVGQLVEANMDQLQFNGRDKILTRAKEYLEAHNSKVEAAKPPPVVLGCFGQKVTPSEPKVEETVVKVVEPDQYLVANHSWYEQKILLPRSVEARELTAADVHGECSLRDAIVYDLSIEPHNRISFICSWMVAEETQDHFCTMTYSPQLLLHFNLALPPLEVTIADEDYNLMPNPQILKNVLWEISVMQLLSGEEQI